MTTAKYGRAREIERDLGIDPAPHHVLTDPDYLEWLDQEIDYKYTRTRVDPYGED